MHELFTFPLRLRTRQHRDHRERNPRRPSRLRALVGMERQSRLRLGKRPARSSQSPRRSSTNWETPPRLSKISVFGEGHYLRPQFIQAYRCRNVLIEGVTIRNSPMWEIHPVLCRNVSVRNVRIDSHGPNNDGCNPESCADVLIQNCIFDTGDDCIAIKSGRNGDGRRLAKPCENLIVADCTMKDGHGGVSIGIEVSGGVRNIFVSDCTMSSPHLERALRIKTNSFRGGVIENVRFRKVNIGQVANDAVQIDFTYEEGEGGPFQPVVRNIYISDVTCGKCADALSLRGYASSPIRNVRVADCTFEHATKPNAIEHVEGLELRNVLINGKRI